MKTGSMLALVALLGVVACDGAGTTGGGTTPTTSSATDVGEFLATVNGVPVGTTEFEAAAARKTPANGESLTDAEKKEVLDELIEEKLLYAEALKKGLDKDPKVQKAYLGA